MRKFLTATLTAATLAGGVFVPAANAGILDAVNSYADKITCNSTQQTVDATGATTKGELIVLLNRMSVNELKLRLATTGTFALDENTKSPLIEKFAAKAEECGAVKQGVLAETSSLVSNTSSVTNKKLSSGETKDENKDKKNFDFSDIFSAFSSGISS